MSGKIVEKIEFLTQIHSAWDGTEQRVGLRAKPRRYISYEYIGVDSRQSQYLRALTCSSQTQLVQFPLWHANKQLSKPIYKGQSIIPLQTEDMWNYRDCEGVMLWTNDEIGGEHLLVKNVSADGVVHLAKQASHDWQTGTTMVIPVFWGILQQEDKYENLTSEHTNMIVNVEFINRGLTVELPEAINQHNYSWLSFTESKNASHEYMGYELFLMPPTWHEDLAMNYSRNANRLDNQTGIIRYDLKSNETTEARSLSYNAISKAEVHFLQRFFYRSMGQLKAFYAPTWVGDIELVADVLSGNVLITKFDQYWKYYEKSKRRKNLIVFFHDGTMEIIKIAGFSLDDTRTFGKIYLDMPIKRAMLKNQIRMISFLCLYRLNSDTLTTDYETTSCAVINLELKEVSA